MVTVEDLGRHAGRQPLLLNIEELADRLTVSVGCIRSWRLKGEGLGRLPGNAMHRSGNVSRSRH